MEENKCAEMKELKKCGLIMPISSIDGCTEQHWQEVMQILKDAIKGAEFDAELVSNADDVGIIQKRIIQNIYENPIVVCDVSGKNPNVMFELGMRLAFDKPTIIVKDDKTGYSFDTSPIEHLEYPRDLRYNKIIEFKEKLSNKIKATYNASMSDQNYTTFLKNFGKFTVAKLETKVISKEDYILEELKELKSIMSSAKNTNNAKGDTDFAVLNRSFFSKLAEVTVKALDNIIFDIGLENEYEIGVIRQKLFEDEEFEIFCRTYKCSNELIDKVIKSYLSKLFKDKIAIDKVTIDKEL